MFDKDTIVEWIQDYWTVIVLCLVILAVVVGIIALIVGSQPVLVEGAVVDKRFTAAHTTTWTQLQEIGDVIIPIQHKTHHPDTWEIHVEGRKENGKPHAEWWEIGSALYERIEIGDRVYRDKDTGVVRK